MDRDAVRAALRCDRPGCPCHRPRGQVHCPAHDDERPSFVVHEAEDGCVLLVHCHAGCSQAAVIEALRERGLWGGRPSAPALSRLVRRGGKPMLEGPINDAACFVEGYVKLPSDHATTTIALWIAHCWVFEAFDMTPYLLVKSAVKQCGKSVLLKILSLLLPKPWFIFNPSEAVLFRRIDRDCPQVLIDESDPLFNGRIAQRESLRALLNAGYERGAVVPRCVGEGAKMNLVDFKVFCPKGIATIGNLPDTIEDRSVIVSMKRATPDERRALRKFRLREAREAAGPIREAFARWADAATPRLREARPAIPGELDGRAADIWEPLLAVADLAGPGWAVAAWQAALALSTGQAREDESLRVRLLADIKSALDARGADRIGTAELIEALVEDDQAPWGDWHGKRITPQAVARLLRPFGVRPVLVRDGATVFRGYTREVFLDPWTRYLAPPPTLEPLHPLQPNGDAGFSHFPEPLQGGSVTDAENGANPHGDCVVTGVTDRTPGEEKEASGGEARTPPDEPGPGRAARLPPASAGQTCHRCGVRLRASHWTLCQACQIMTGAALSGEVRADA
jgi:hypothetical protein